MNENHPNWLTKEMISGIRRFNLDAYLVALEGWRRGLNLKWYYDASNLTNIKLVGFNSIGKLFSLGDDKDIFFFYRSRGDKVNNSAVEITSNKDETKKYLKQANVPTPKSIRFDESMDLGKVFDSFTNLSESLVIKPTFGSLGKGVVTDIRSKQDFLNSVSHIRENLDYKDFLLEQYVTGNDVRLYVVGTQVVAALSRFPANITGNGVSSIEELIHNKNEERINNPSLSSKLIKIDYDMKEFLRRQDMDLNDVPEKDKVVYLKGTSNISAGGDSIDITDQISSEVKKVAIEAVKAIPGLLHAGVDLIVNEDKATVIEINATADIAMHVFPLNGEPRNVPASIIDYYFPQTKGSPSTQNKIYYDHKTILQLIKSRSIKEVEVSQAPQGELYSKRYVSSGNVQGVGYRDWIRKKALQNNLSGYTRNLKNGKVVVVVGGIDRKTVDDFKNICLEGPLRAKVENVEEYIWDKRIRVGFEIRTK
ncbi:acylphosphatase [Virgibacillus halodenitrificans]|uniref:acylphosphatase n=1 Tax=Virgibacillus halodenitrificans TaxID=1482 RepID=UPI000761F203